MKLSEIEEIFKKHALNNKEIEKNVKDGLLAEDIFEIVTKYDEILNTLGINNIWTKKCIYSYN